MIAKGAAYQSTLYAIILPRLGSAEKATQPDNHQPYMRCVIQRSARTKPNARPSNDSMQSRAASTSLMHRVDFHVVLRKLISEVQAVS